MLKDDRMMSMFTFLVIMVAIGTLIQRGDLLSKFFGDGGVPVQLVNDEVTVRANQLSPIDVLANDVGLSVEDRGKVEITAQPACGRVFMRDGLPHYLPAQRCVGAQSFEYTVSGRGDLTGRVDVVVRLGDETEAPVAAAMPREATMTPGTQATRETQPAPASAPQTRPDSEEDSRTADVPSAPNSPGAASTGPGAPPGAAVPEGAPGGGDRVAEAPIDDAPASPAAIAPGLAERGTAENPSPAGPVDAARTPPVSMGQGREAESASRNGDPGRFAAVDRAPAAPAGPTAPAGQGSKAGAQQPERFAALPAPTRPCAILPTLTIVTKPAGITEVAVDAPCQSSTVAELSYDSIKLKMAISRVGTGSVDAIGFSRSSKAVLRFADKSETAFDLFFSDMERLDRVAVVWDEPVELELHAFEFGARTESEGHVGPSHPRSYREVRREGGGYLTHFDPPGNSGERLRVYTFLRRYDGPVGVVRLSVDFASRKGSGAPDTCGDGALAEPEFRVIRSEGGKLARPEWRRLAPLNCAVAAQGEDRFIADAVDDMIVRRR